MATKHSQPRSLYGTAKAHGDAQAQAARVALAEAGQGHQAGGDEEAEGDVVALRRQVAAAVARERREAQADGGEIDLPTPGGEIAFQRTDAALKRLVTEPGETWVLETDEPPAVAMAALAAWSQTRGVVVLVFGEGEHFSRLSTQPGDTVVIHTAHVENLNQPALAGWAQSRGLSLAVLPPDISLELVNDATLDALHLMRKPGGLIIPSAEQWAQKNGRPS